MNWHGPCRKNQVNLCNRLEITNHQNLIQSVIAIFSTGGRHHVCLFAPLLPVLYLGHYSLKKVRGFTTSSVESGRSVMIVSRSKEVIFLVPVIVVYRIC